jgi:hypothetical protein
LPATVPLEAEKAPPLGREAVSPKTEPAPPLLSESLLAHGLPDVTFMPSDPLSPLVGGVDEPSPFNRVKTMVIIIFFSGVLLLCVLVTGCAVIWKKREYAKPLSNEEFLRRINAAPVPIPEKQPVRERYNIAADRGLLQKATALKKQMA